VSLQIIAKALGHTTTKMAERYARPSEEAMRAITRALDADALDSVSIGSAPPTPPANTVVPPRAHRA
jgi:hypothetical protein